MLFLAVANGTARDFLYQGSMGELAAHQVSCLTAGALFLAYMILLDRRVPFADPKVAWRVGAMWLAMTLAFEFLFMHYAAGHPWSRLLADYDVAAGRLWVLVLAVVGAGPRLVLAIRRRPGRG